MPLREGQALPRAGAWGTRSPHVHVSPRLYRAKPAGAGYIGNLALPSSDGSLGHAPEGAVTGHEFVNLAGYPVGG